MCPNIRYDDMTSTFEKNLGTKGHILEENRRLPPLTAEIRGEPHHTVPVNGAENLHHSKHPTRRVVRGQALRASAH